MLLLRGVTMVYTNGSPVIPALLRTPICLAGLVLVVRWRTDASLDHGNCLPRGLVHADHTRLGRYIYALGGNEAATRFLVSTSIKSKSSSILFVVCCIAGRDH